MCETLSKSSGKVIIDGTEYDVDLSVPLERHWVYWIHKACFTNDYENSRYPLHSDPISTVQEFWSYYANLPGPSGLLQKNTKKNFASQNIIEGWSVFEYGVKPDWEDKANQNGCTITFRGYFTGLQIDNTWKYTLLSIIGETIPFRKEIKGARVVNRNTNYRIEIWMSSNDDTKIEQVQNFFRETIFCDPNTPAKLVIFSSPHNTAHKT